MYSTLHFAFYMKTSNENQLENVLSEINEAVKVITYVFCS